MLSKAKALSLFSNTEVRSLFLINFIFENELSPLLFVTISDRYILKATSILGKQPLTF